MYTFENLCRQDNTIPLGDRALKYFFISDNCDKLLNEEQRAFLRLVSGQEGSDAFTRRIASLTDGVKRNMEYKRQFMEWERQKTYLFNKGKEEGIAEGKAAGILEGEQKKAVEATRNFLKEGISPEIIAKCTGLPIEEVQKLQAELAVNA